MKKLVCFIVVLAIAGTASAEWSKVGSSGAQFLKIGVGSRYQGMGEASVATVNDVYSMHWNPAGLVEIDHTAVGFTSVDWLLDVSLNYVGFAHYFEDVGTFGASAMVLSMDDQEITTLEEQNGTGEYYSASSYALGLTYARQITAKFAFGASFKYVGERIDNETASGFAFDFGTTLYTGFKSLRLGMSIANMGPELQFAGSDLDVTVDESTDDQSDRSVSASVKSTPYDLPMTFRVGVAYDVDFGPKSILTLSGEVKHPNDVAQQGSLGAEFNYDNNYFLRGGYKLNSDEEGLSFGGGWSTTVTGDTRLMIDYAWQDFGRLQSTQRFSVGFTF